MNVFKDHLKKLKVLITFGEPKIKYKEKKKKVLDCEFWVNGWNWEPLDLDFVIHVIWYGDGMGP